MYHTSKQKNQGPSTPNNRWIDSKEASKILGRGYGRSSIYRKIAEGALVEGIHFIRTGAKTLKLDVTRIMEEWEDNAW